MKKMILEILLICFVIMASTVIVVTLAGCGGSPPDAEPGFVKMPAPVYVHVDKEDKHEHN